MHNKSQRQSVERRSGTDRRSWVCQLEFPYIDSHGMLVTEERRKKQRRDVEAMHAQIKSAHAS